MVRVSGLPSVSCVGVCLPVSFVLLLRLVLACGFSACPPVPGEGSERVPLARSAVGGCAERSVVLRLP